MLCAIHISGGHWHLLMMKDRASEYTDISVMAKETGGCRRAKEPRVRECEYKGASSLGYPEPKSSAADGLVFIFIYLSNLHKLKSQLHYFIKQNGAFV